MQNNTSNTTTPSVSVVIPTHNRARSLGHTLETLAKCRGEVVALEVIVVDDGSTDDTVQYLRSRDWGLDLKLVSQEQSGVAVARNTGARAASAPVLVFIDDDIAPAKGFLAAHLDTLWEVPGCVSIGPLAPSDDPGANPPGWWRWLEWQFEKQYAEIQAGTRRLNGLSLYSGNFALPRALFWEVGGFDENATHCEDTELGLRLEQAGAPFCLTTKAVGHHSGYRSFDSWRQTAYREGYWDSEQMLKMRRIFGLRDLVHEFHQRHPLLRFVARAVLDRPTLFRLSTTAMRGIAVLAGSLGLRKVERYAYGGIYDLTYWQGLCNGLGGFTLLQRYLQNPSTLEVMA